MKFEVERIEGYSIETENNYYEMIWNEDENAFVLIRIKGLSHRYLKNCNNLEEAKQIILDWEMEHQ